MAAFTDEDFFGFHEAIDSKATPFAIGNWVAMVTHVEGRDKVLKLVQYLARSLKWCYLQQGNIAESESFANVQSSVLESRKSMRLLKGG